MPARFIDPVLGDIETKPSQSFAHFMQKVDKHIAILPLSDAASSTYVTYEPLYRSYVVRQAIKLAHCLDILARREPRMDGAKQHVTPESLEDEVFDLPDTLLEAHENVFGQSVLANGVIANLSDLCDRLREQVGSLENRLKAKKSPVSSGETKVLESLRKLVISMAWGAYRFNPYLSRNAATADIRQDLELLGLKLDDETMLTHFREAVEVLTEEGKQVLMTAAKPVKANSP
jgi:hypothetical protein